MMDLSGRDEECREHEEDRIEVREDVRPDDLRGAVALLLREAVRVAGPAPATDLLRGKPRNFPYGRGPGFALYGSAIAPRVNGRLYGRLVNGRILYRFSFLYVCFRHLLFQPAAGPVCDLAILPFP